jgi:arginine decarboxylase
LNRLTYSDHLRNRYGVSGDGAITDFLSRREGRLLLGHRVDLNSLVAHYGAPLEVAYCPLITSQIERMHDWAEQARARSGYASGFVYAYATKANFAEEVVRTALAAGAHYETSAAADVVIAHQLWRQGVLPGERYIFCNGSKDADYIDAIAALRRAGYVRVVPVLDDLDELEGLLARCSEPLLLGVRERHAPDDVSVAHPGGERFGLTQHEIRQVAARLSGTPHRLVLYHAMVGSQIEDIEAWSARLARSIGNYSAVSALAPALHMFNFGGGMPTSAYAVDFAFDYAGFLEQLMRGLAERCAAAGVAQPTIVGEFGRYTVASHSVFLMEVGAIKPGQAREPDWFLMNGSLMVTLPDMLFVEGQQFVVLALDGWHRPAVEARLGGRLTCDSDDFYPRPGQPPLVLPAVAAGQGDASSVIAIFGVGAYQQMISGRGGAHHCLTPEMRRIIIEQDGDALVVHEVAPQQLDEIMGALGYQRTLLEQLPAPRPSVQTNVQVERSNVATSHTSTLVGDRRPIRESVLASRTPRRRQPTFPPRPVTPREPRNAASA